MEKTRISTFTGFTVMFLLCHVHAISSIAGTSEKRITADVSSNAYHRKKRSTCGSEIFGHSGIIESPNYPNSYPSYARCTWVIRAPERSRIVLRFDAFETENSCDFDRLEVRDGPSSSSNLLKQICGTSIPLPIESSGNTMTLLFKSDGSVEKQGFKAQFQSVMDCGGEIISEDGDVTSPNYPQKYDKLQDCVWVIRVPNNYQVQLRFRSFQLENSRGCTADFVEVQDGSKASAPYLGRFCGSELPEEIRSSGNAMMIRFISDDRDEKRGFSAHFQKVLPAIEEPKSMGIRNIPAVLMICTILCFILPNWT